MPTSYTDQFYTFDPANPPPGGTSITWVELELVDQNDDGDIDRFNNDRVGGLDVTASWPGDTVRVDVPGVGIVDYTGVTFYRAGGVAVFTPTDGQVLQNGTLVSTTFVTVQGSVDPPTDLAPPCFVAGTLIETPAGPRAVEDLAVGDWVITLDHGPQEVRWIGQQTVAARGDLAPIRFAPGAIGNSRLLWVSPQHRVLLTGWRCELHFGAAEALVPAKHLVDGDRICRVPQPATTYLHLLFDRHEIVFSEGAATESFHPGDWILAEQAGISAELQRIFPELSVRELPGAFPLARPVPRAREARMLAGAGRMA